MIMARPDRLSSTSRTNSDFDRAPRQPREGFGLDADRKHADAHDTLADREAVARNRRQVGFVVEITGEIGGVDFGLEADQVVLAERRNELLVVGQRGEDFRRRARHVEEKADLVLVAALAQRACASGIR